MSQRLESLRQFLPYVLRRVLVRESMADRAVSKMGQRYEHHDLERYIFRAQPPPSLAADVVSGAHEWRDLPF